MRFSSGVKHHLRGTDDLAQAISFIVILPPHLHQLNFKVHQITPNGDTSFQAKTFRISSIVPYDLHLIIKAPVTYGILDQGAQLFLKNYLGAITLLLVADCVSLDLTRLNEDEGAVFAFPY